MRIRATPAALAFLLMLAGCGGDGGAPAVVFKPPSYDYLTKLRLNVGDVRIEDQSTASTGPNDLGAQAPTPPAQAMRRMAEDRLVAAGNSGTAVFTIDQAAITGQPGGTLDGTLAAHLDIIGQSGGHNGYAEAHVSRQFVPGADTDNDGLKRQLYDLTDQMMNDMNVELEYQVRRTLGDWLLDASGAPVGAAVEQQSLAPATSGPAPGPAAGAATTATSGPVALAPVPVASPAGSPPSASNSVGAPMQLAPPSGTPLPDGVPPADTSGPMQLAPPPQADTPPPAAVAPAAGATGAPAAPVAASSPPPGFLRLPNGYLQAIPSTATQQPASQQGPTQLAPAGY